MAGRNPSSLLAGNEAMVRVKRAVDGRGKGVKKGRSRKNNGKRMGRRKNVKSRRRSVKTRKGTGRKGRRH